MKFKEFQTYIQMRIHLSSYINNCFCLTHAAGTLALFTIEEVQFKWGAEQTYGMGKILKTSIFELYKPFLWMSKRCLK